MGLKSKALVLIPVIYFILTLLLFSYAFSKQGVNINRLVGFGIATSAFIFWIISRIQLGDAFSLTARAKFVVKGGIYKHIRHPVYVFSSFALLGIAIFYNSLLIFLALGALIMLEVVRARKEEDVLGAKFGKSYAKYLEQTWF